MKEKKAEVLNELKRLFQSGRYLAGSKCSNAILTMGLAAAPTIPLSTLAEVMPVLSMGTHMYDSGLTIQPKFSLPRFTTSFPSAPFMRGQMYELATMCIIQMANKMKGLPVHLATDKGMIHML
jgi:hypothetical protein